MRGTQRAGGQARGEHREGPPKLAVVVVLPTPPLPDVTTITRACRRDAVRRDAPEPGSGRKLPDVPCRPRPPRVAQRRPPQPQQRRPRARRALFSRLYQLLVQFVNIKEPGYGLKRTSSLRHAPRRSKPHHYLAMCCERHWAHARRPPRRRGPPSGERAECMMRVQHCTL